MPVQPIELRHMLDAELAAQIDHRLSDPVRDPLLIGELVDTYALWPAAVLTSPAVDGDLEIGNGIEQWQIADRTLDMLVDALARPVAAVAVHRDTFSGLERDVDLIGIALAALHAGDLKAFPLTERVEECLTLVHKLSTITCDRSDTRPLPH